MTDLLNESKVSDAMDNNATILENQSQKLFDAVKCFSYGREDREMALFAFYKSKQTH